REYCQSEFSVENILFWKAVCDFEDLAAEQINSGHSKQFMVERVVSIFHEYVSPDGFLEVNISSKCRKDVESVFYSLREKERDDEFLTKVLPTIFESSKGEILN